MPHEPVPLHPQKQMRVTMMLADYAVGTPDGKLTVVGAGWKLIAVGAPFAVAAIVEVPWDLTNTKHTLQLRLVDADGQPLTMPDGQPLELPPDVFEVPRPAGVKPGTSIAHNVVLNSGPLPFEPGQYVWEITINGAQHEEWKLPFTVVAAGPQAQAA